MIENDLQDEACYEEVIQCGAVILGESYIWSTFNTPEGIAAAIKSIQQAAASPETNFSMKHARILIEHLRNTIK